LQELGFPSETSRKSAEVLVVGAGAIGVALTHCLTSAGLNVLVRARQGVVSLNQYLHVDGQTVPVATPQSYGSDDMARFGLVLFSVKAYDLARSLEDVAGELSDGCVCVVCCNGYVIDIVKQAQKHWPKLVWRHGYTTMAVSCDHSSGCFIRVDQGGKLFWGALDREQDADLGPMEKLVFSRLAEQFVWQEELYSGLAKKWLFNVVINTMCAAYHLGYNGKLLERLVELQAVFAEAYELTSQLWGENTLKESGDVLFAQMLELIERTSMNENSMALDHRCGRKLEHPYLAGKASSLERFPHLNALSKRL